MRLLEMISGSVVAPGGGFTPLVPNGIDSFKVRDFDIAKSKAYLVGVNGSISGTDQGVIRIRSPHFHDIINGIQIPSNPSDTNSGWLPFVYPELYPGDVLDIQATGSADTDAWSLIIFYENVPGFKTKFVDVDFIKKYKKRVFTLTTGGISFTDDGTYQQMIAPNRLQDLLSAKEYNRYYVITSIAGADNNPNASIALGGLTSVDWGNVQIPMILSTAYPYNDYFKFLSKRLTPQIFPIFHSENVNQIVTKLFAGGAGGGYGSIYSLSLVELTQEANPLLDAMGEEIVTDENRSVSQ